MEDELNRKKAWLDQKEIKNIMLFLHGHDMSTAQATKIYKQYGAGSMHKRQITFMGYAP